MFGRFTFDNTTPKSRRPRFIAISLIVFVTVFAIAGVPAHGAFAQSAPSGTLRVGWTPPISLDPALYGDAPDESIGVAVYDYLYTVNQQAELVPSLAKSSTVSADGLTYTLTLQSGVKFKDGSAFTADDVKFTIQRLQDPKVGSSAKSLFSGVTAIDVVDPQTVKFTLSAPSPTFLNNLADYHVAILKNGTVDPTKDFNGTGPFTVTADQIDLTTGATLTANPNYWKGAPKIAKLQFVFNSDVSALVQALKGGQLDFVARITNVQYKDLQQDSAVTPVDIPTNLFPNIRLRTDQKPGSDPKVLQAFRLAIDHDALNQALYSGLAAPGYDFPVGPLYKTLYTAPTSFPKPDAAQAKQLLSDAGYPQGLTVDLYFANDEFNNQDLAQLLQQQLAKANITVNLQGSPSSVYYGTAANNWLDADFAITGWSTRSDPQAYFNLMYHTQTSDKSEGVWNEAHWSDATVDKLIEQAGQETDITKRAAIYAQLEAIFIDHGPSFIPFFRPLLAAQNAKVTGIEVEPDPGLTSFATAVIAS